MILVVSGSLHFRRLKALNYSQYSSLKGMVFFIICFQTDIGILMRQSKLAFSYSFQPIAEITESQIRNEATKGWATGQCD